MWVGSSSSFGVKLKLENFWSLSSDLKLENLNIFEIFKFEFWPRDRKQKKTKKQEKNYLFEFFDVSQLFRTCIKISKYFSQLKKVLTNFEFFQVYNLSNGPKKLKKSYFFSVLRNILSRFRVWILIENSKKLDSKKLRIFRVFSSFFSSRVM